MSWQVVEIINENNQQRKFPSCAAVYAVYVNGGLYYIGSTCHLRKRMSSTWCHKEEDRVFREAQVVIKFSRSRKYGDWLMREIRLIHRLKPRANRQNPKRLVVTDVTDV